MTRRNLKFLLPVVALLAVFAGAIAFVVLNSSNIAVLNAHGQVADKERGLMYFTLLLSAVVVVPVFAMAFGIVWRYRAGRGARYTPDADHDGRFEALWWGIPILVIGVLAVVCWTSSHDLDPYKALQSSQRPLTIQVVALDWKWLFIYPEQHVASVNFVELPVGRPVNFAITADAPMNSFWIPELGGQVYAMPGMSSELHLIADRAGDYRGSSVNISGVGYAGMHFVAHAAAPTDFDAWVKQAAGSKDVLSGTSYELLARPSKDVPPKQYRLVDDWLYATIVEKYMTPSGAD